MSDDHGADGQRARHRLARARRARPWRRFAAAEARARVAAARAVVERAAAGERPIYGLNTGLGGNLKYRLAPEEITAFQTQFVVGRAIGVGEPLPRATVRAAMLARANAMALGGAGVSPAVLDLLIALLNRDVTPVVPRWGSIGAGRPRVARAHRARRSSGADRPSTAAACSRAPTRCGGGTRAGDAGTEGRARLVQRQRAVRRRWRASRCTAARRVLRQSERAAALSFEGYAANPTIFDPSPRRGAPGLRPGRRRAAVSRAPRRIVAVRRGRGALDPGCAELPLPVAGSRRGPRRDWSAPSRPASSS